MEHRELPRIVADERRLDGALEDNGVRIPFRGFPFMRSQRRIQLGRAGPFIFIVLIAVIVLCYLGSRAARTAFSWLHHQPRYQLPFDEIRLIPEPPPWFRGGRQAFLKGVRRDAREAENIPVLDLTPEQLAVEFKNYAWVREVENVLYRPNAITVHLRYRQPVAYVQLLPHGDQILVDETGTILNIEDVDLPGPHYLMVIRGEGLVAPSDPKPGHIWKSRPEGGDHDEPDRRILAASKLAGFLSRPAQLDDAKRSRAMRMMEIHVSASDPPGLFLRNFEDAWIWWKEAPGDESPWRPTASEKWEMLRRWRESGDHRPIPENEYWAFTTTRVEHRHPEPTPDKIKEKQAVKRPRME